MARELKGAPILLVATYREAEVRRSVALSKLIGELSREAHSIPVSGLSEPEVARLIELRAGQTPDQALVTKLCAATNGNPLFVDGIIRMLIADGSIGSAGGPDRPFKIPGGIREAIRNRLDGLSPGSNAILAVAAAIGNEFEFNLCQSVAGVAAADAYRFLDEAARAGIVTAPGYGRYRFSHALIREAVYDELDTNGRVRIHGKIANRIEEIHREDIEAHLAELAHHFREAGLTEKAIDYSARAGRAASLVFAWTDATTHRLAALELMEQHGTDARRRAELLGLLGSTAFEADPPKSAQYFEAAIALYENIGCFGEAALLRVRLASAFAMPGQPLYNGALAYEHYHRAESVLAKGPETTSLALLYARIAQSDSQRMDLVQSARAARRAMEISGAYVTNLAGLKGLPHTDSVWSCVDN
jgi:predicted ATPase